jgi:hypothetical protein
MSAMTDMLVERPAALRDQAVGNLRDAIINGGAISKILRLRFACSACSSSSASKRELCYHLAGRAASRRSSSRSFSAGAGNMPCLRLKAVSVLALVAPGMFKASTMCARRSAS